MTYYQEISLLPNAEITPYFIWQKVYQQIHLALVEYKNPDDTSSIGVAFPDYKTTHYSLGKTIRLFTENDQLLNNMQCKEWLRRLSDYTSVSEIKAVPERVEGYASFRHVKLKGRKEKLARRRAKRKGESFEQALSYYANYEEQQSKLPYINMVSQTNCNRFRLYIEKQNLDKPYEGFFSCYGLSSNSTVPLF